MTDRNHDWEEIDLSEPNWTAYYSKRNRTLSLTFTGGENCTNSEVIVREGHVARVRAFDYTSGKRCEDSQQIRTHWEFAQKLLNTGVIDE